MRWFQNSVKFRFTLQINATSTALGSGSNKEDPRTVAITHCSLPRCDPGAKNGSLKPQDAAAWGMGRQAAVADHFRLSATRPPIA